LEVEKNFFFGLLKNKGLGHASQTISSGTQLAPSTEECLYVPRLLRWQVKGRCASAAKPCPSTALSGRTTGGKIAVGQPSTNHLHYLRPKKDKNFTSPELFSSFPSPSTSITTTNIAVVIQLLEPTWNHEPLHSPLGTGL
jgi:hypothetical protein